MRLYNPYRDAQGQWVRGNLHGHTAENSGCASVPLRIGTRMYHDLGARFMAVTDHDCVTDLEEMKVAYPDMVFLQGVEHSSGAHWLFIGEKVPPLHELPLNEALARAGDGILKIAAHPCANDEDTRTREMLMAFAENGDTQGLPQGIEIFDGHYSLERMVARGVRFQYTRLWDELLTAGLRLWGFANDDFHDLADLDNAFNMVLIEEQSAGAVLEAAKSGRFYASTGLTLEQITETDGRIVVNVGRPCTGRFIGPGGKCLSEAQGTRFEHVVTDESYVRFEAQAGRAQLFLQPMFAEDGG